MSKTYRIMRVFESGDFRVIRTGLNLNQAKRYCANPETSSETATGDFARAFTRKHGRWFDGYDEEA